VPTPLKVLCLDIEGGHGGSSRSLFHLLKNVDRKRIEPVVWCRKGGVVENWYKGLSIPCLVYPEMPKVSALPRFSRNLLVFSQAVVDFVRAREFRRKLLYEARHLDLVHFNHEALFLLAGWMARRSPVVRTMHIRTNLWDTMFARWQTRMISEGCHRLVFITENEMKTHRGLGGTASGDVIFNVAEMPDPLPSPNPTVAALGGVRLACLSNYGWNRGVDRLIDVALALRGKGAKSVRFVIAGDMKLTRSLPGRLGEVARRGGSLEDYAREMGVADMFLFLGHVNNPESVLAACHALVKPTREYNPWGRDILEALAMGKPVVSVGTYNRFVENDKTGLLFEEFSADEFACGIAELAADPCRMSKMGKDAAQRVRRLCNGPERAAELMNFWETAYQMCSQRG